MANQSAPWRQWAMPLIVAVLAGGLSFYAGEVRNDVVVENLAKDLAELKKELRLQDQRTDTVRDRVAKVEFRTQNLPPADLLLRIKNVEEDLEELVGEVGMRYRTTSAVNANRLVQSQIEDLKRRLDKLETTMYQPRPTGLEEIQSSGVD